MGPALVLFALALGVSPAHADSLLGRIDFPVTGSEAARSQFVRGVLALHSFWYEEALAAFRASTATEPGFAMGYWGEALANSKLFWRLDDVPAARAALAKLPPLESLTARERAFVEALRPLFGEGDTRRRRSAFAASMERLHRAYPDDDEAAAFTALALISALPDDESARVGPRARAAALGMAILARNPDHPGAAHYVIHALDTPDLAPLALPAARRYAEIAPAAYHARHMPAHIFSRLGMWPEALASCQSAWAASEAWVAKARLDPSLRDFHSLGWIVEIELERGRRRAAEQALATFARAVKESAGPVQRAAYAAQVLSFLQRTEDWQQGDRLLAPLAAPPPAAAGAHASMTGCGSEPSADGLPAAQYQAMAVATIRAEAAAARRDQSGLHRHLDEIEAQARQTAAYEIGQGGRAQHEKRGQLDRHMRAALRGRAKGDDGAVVAALRSATPVADTLPREGVGSGPEPHELLGEALLRLGDAAGATSAFTSALHRHPNRSRSMLGAARAAARAGDAAGAREMYGRLAAVWSGADDDFPGVDEARRNGASPGR
jgi:hypothetical protein